MADMLLNCPTKQCTLNSNFLPHKGQKDQKISEHESPARNSSSDTDDDTPFNVDEIWKREFSKVFNTCFYPDLWGLQKIGDGDHHFAEAPVNTELVKWYCFKECAKVRYCCNICGNGWTSMRGQVSFWFYLFDDYLQVNNHSQLTEKIVEAPILFRLYKNDNIPNTKNNIFLIPRRIGLLKFQVFGQQCGSKNCKINQKLNISENSNNSRSLGFKIENSQLFEYPIWYPEEITKSLENVFNEIRATLYNGPAPIRYTALRDGKPRGNHNPNLCLACKKGTCKFNAIRNTDPSMNDSSPFLRSSPSTNKSRSSRISPNIEVFNRNLENTGNKSNDSLPCVFVESELQTKNFSKMNLIPSQIKINENQKHNSLNEKFIKNFKKVTTNGQSSNNNNQTKITEYKASQQNNQSFYQNYKQTYEGSNANHSKHYFKNFNKNSQKVAQVESNLKINYRESPKKFDTFRNIKMKGEL